MFDHMWRVFLFQSPSSNFAPLRNTNKKNCQTFIGQTVTEKVQLNFSSQPVKSYLISKMLVLFSMCSCTFLVAKNIQILNRIADEGLNSQVTRATKFHVVMEFN